MSPESGPSLSWDRDGDGADGAWTWTVLGVAANTFDLACSWSAQLMAFALNMRLAKWIAAGDTKRVSRLARSLGKLVALGLLLNIYLCIYENVMRSLGSAVIVCCAAECPLPQYPGLAPECQTINKRLAFAELTFCQLSALKMCRNKILNYCTIYWGNRRM